MHDSHPIQIQIDFLEALLTKLLLKETYREKIAVLDELPEVKELESAHLNSFFESLPDESHFAVKSLAAIGQRYTLLALVQDKKMAEKTVRTLEEIDQFYGPHGMIHYQLNVLKLLVEKEKNVEGKVYSKPSGLDLSLDSEETRKVVRYGIEHLGRLAEIYPVGGAGERLNLTLPNGEPLPVALLPFLGTSLLEGLVRDLEAREFLYYKLTGNKLRTPIVLMVSDERDNLSHILKLLEEKNWFSRGKELFFLFSQPMVPVLTIEGEWVLSSNQELLLRPGGHGVIWKLAKEKKAFKWLKELKRDKLLVRQINNPIAGVDGGLLGFTGAGFKGDYLFGFSSCPRHLHASEGMDVLVEEKRDNRSTYKLTNVEYTEFVKNGIVDHPEVVGSHFSKFPANTNILFADIETVEKAVENSPIPGLLINMKTTIPHINQQGLLTRINAGRLESTMQNIADLFSSPSITALKTYLTYNNRNKTISVTKKSFQPHHSFLETPESAFYDMCKNHQELFSKFCQMEVAELASPESYLENGPSLMVLYHPALGPLYSVIGQKIQGGKLFKNAELQLEIAELEIKNLTLKGSLLIEAENVTGLFNEKGNGKCVLKNVKINNLGIDRSAKNTYWKNAIARKESLKIVLHGNGELIAENVELNGNLFFEVQGGERLIVSSNGNELIVKREAIEEEKELWSYAFDAEDHIKLQKMN